MSTELTQQEIDAVFDRSHAARAGEPDAKPFDFRGLDRIPKSQLRAINVLHEEFAHSLSSSLSAYLRSQIVVNLISLEQVSYSEYTGGLTSPTCIAYLSLKPYDGTAILEMSPDIVFTMVENILGGGKHASPKIQRKITDIEKIIVQTILRVVLHDLDEAWKSVADVRFSLQSLASEPQLLHALSPSEAVVVVTLEIRIGEVSGVLNLTIPSILIKRLRRNFEQLRQAGTQVATAGEQIHMAKLVRRAAVSLEVCLEGVALTPNELLKLDVGDVIVCAHALQRPVVGVLNGVPKFRGEIVLSSQKRCFSVGDAIRDDRA
jgi:flagellar motor switch protein FliM